MKKLLHLLITLFLLQAFSAFGSSKKDFFSFLELDSGFTFNIPKTAYEKNDAELSTFQFNYGANLRLLPLDLRFYQGTYVSTFREIRSLSSDSFSESFKPCSWSVLLEADKLPFFNQLPLKLYAGTLSYSKAISKQRNPAFYKLPSPFISGLEVNKGIGITQASKYASSKPISVALSYNKGAFFIEGAYSFDCNAFLSSGFTIVARDFLKISTVVSLSTFDAGNACSDSWMQPKPFFSNEKYHTGYLETAVSMPLLKTKLSCLLIQNPAGTLRSCQTAEILFHYGLFSISGGVFISDSVFFQDYLPVLTAGNSFEKTLFQLRLTPQIEFFTKQKTRIKTGFTLLYDKSLEDLTFDRPVSHNLDIAYGINAYGKKDNAGFLYRYQKDNHTFIENYSHKFETTSLKVTSKTSLSFPVSRISDFSQGLSLTASISNFPINSISGNITVLRKNSKLSLQSGATVSAKFNLKNVKFTGKIQFSTSVLVE